ncbi:hypothetical protein DMA15_05025 [Streptomyces sp. WAC 01529]|uniref:hypothetical protein n=1 Tax=Streptomyces sp. WAC 01529 TaxID=2203205 RepID=UPI000F6E5796|nr:hypothetical protein [Streptomyces sp. WAC 01529]AZM52030.1 hypothetical protein DMA15_05025 [Streptomyces sp. WAC 01529]
MGRAVPAIGGAIALVATVTGPATAAARPGDFAAPVNLHTLTCHENEDATSGDRVYLQINGRTVWNSADTLRCDRDAPTIRSVDRLAKTGDTVSLYADDFPDADDHLGSDTVEAAKGTLTFNLDDALYTLEHDLA